MGIEVTQPLRIAIVGAGPAGIYSAEALCKANAAENIPMRIDILDRVPSPFGLVRYGVAPDHVSIRSVRDTLDRVLEDPAIRFFGNVELVAPEDEQLLGTSDTQPLRLSMERLRDMYDAVVLSYGAATDRSLGIPGEDAQGCLSATEFVAWYTGHPDTPEDAWTQLLSSATQVAVLGVGNVAVDVVRVLAKTREELNHTDMPEHVLAALANSSITDIYLLGRRGPAEATWTTKELRELGELLDADIVVDPDTLELGLSSQELVANSKVAGRNMSVVNEWATREPTDRTRRIHVRFFRRPVEVLTSGNQVVGLRIEATALTDEGRLVGLEQYEDLTVDAVIRSVGYRGLPVAEIPFDDSRGVIPNADGRVLDGAEPVPGVYVAGWIKRGPSGIIGTNKKDAVNTIESLLADVEAGVIQPRGEVVDLADLLGAYVDHEGWQRIDAAERELGATRGRDRTTIHTRAQSLSVATLPTT